MEFLQNWQELLAGFLSGGLALIGVAWSLNRASKRQAAAREVERKVTSDAIQEWYHGKIVDLKNYLFSRCFEVQRVYNQIPDEGPISVGHLEVLVDLQIDAMTGADAPPDLLNENLATQFSEVENGRVRGLITILATQTSRFLDEVRYNFYELSASLQLLDPDEDADEEIKAKFKRCLKVQLMVNDTLLDTANQALDALPWKNDYLKEWQASSEAKVDKVFAELDLKRGTEEE